MYLEGRLTKIMTAILETHQNSHYCISSLGFFYSFSDFCLKKENNEWESGVNDGPDWSFITTSSSRTVSPFYLLSAFCGLQEAVLPLPVSGLGKIKNPPLLEDSGLTTSASSPKMLSLLHVALRSPWGWSHLQNPSLLQPRLMFQVTKLALQAVSHSRSMLRYIVRDKSGLSKWRLLVHLL